VRSLVVAKSGRRLRRHPEILVLAIAAISWVLLFWLHGHHDVGGQHLGDQLGGAPMGQHHHGAERASGDGGSAGPAGGMVHAASDESAGQGTGKSVGPWMAVWMLMSVAMMIPAVVPAVRHVTLNSLRRRAPRAVAAFLITYLGAWVGFGFVMFAALGVLRGRLSERVLLGIALAIMLAWALLPFQIRYRRGCHRSVPLPLQGWRADVGCMKFGMRQAQACVGLCWPLMLIMALQLDAGMEWMIAVSAAVLVWKYAPRKYRPTLPSPAAWRLVHARTPAETMPELSRIQYAFPSDG
jgi:predicted metal-binding membrane protein